MQQERITTYGPGCLLSKVGKPPGWYTCPSRGPTSLRHVVGWGSVCRYSTPLWALHTSLSWIRNRPSGVIPILTILLTWISHGVVSGFFQLWLHWCVISEQHKPVMYIDLQAVFIGLFRKEPPAASVLPERSLLTLFWCCYDCWGAVHTRELIMSGILPNTYLFTGRAIDLLSVANWWLPNRKTLDEILMLLHQWQKIVGVGGAATYTNRCSEKNQGKALYIITDNN